MQLEASPEDLDLVRVVEPGECFLESPFADVAPRAHHIRPDLYPHRSAHFLGLLGRRWDAEHVSVSVNHHVSTLELGYRFRSGDFVLSGQLCCAPIGAKGHEDGVRRRLVCLQLPALDQRADVVSDELSLAARTAGHLRGEGRHVAKCEHVGVAWELERRGDLNEAILCPGCCEVASEVVALRGNAVAAKPEVGRDFGAGLGADRESAKHARGRGRWFVQRASEYELNSVLFELAVQLPTQLRLEPSAEQVADDVDDGDLLGGPDCCDLASELDPDRARAKQQHSFCSAERLVAVAEACSGLAGVLSAALAGKRVTRPGSEHDEVWNELLARPKHYPVRADLYCSIADHATVLKQSVIGEMDAIRPGRIDERTEGGDVVLERTLG